MLPNYYFALLLFLTLSSVTSFRVVSTVPETSNNPVELITFTLESESDGHPWSHSTPSDSDNPYWFNYFEASNNIPVNVLNYFNNSGINTDILYENGLYGVWTSFTSEYCFGPEDCFVENPTISFTKESVDYTFNRLEISFVMEETSIIKVYGDFSEIQTIQGTQYHDWSMVSVADISCYSEITMQLSSGGHISGSYILLDRVVLYAETIPTPQTTTTTEAMPTTNTDLYDTTTELVATSASPTTAEPDITETTSQGASSTTDHPEYETTPEITPWPVVRFEIDINGDGDPWCHSMTSEDPITVNWFSYFSSWRPADMNHVAEYFQKHGINTASLENTTNQGFWTSFSNQNCYLIPDTEMMSFTEDTTTSEPPIDCNDREYPHFTLEFTDPSRYILTTLEITYAMHPNSSIVIKETNEAEIYTIEFEGDEECPSVWSVFTYNFANDEEYAKIQIDLTISSDDLDSGEFILIDKIVVKVLDTNYATTTTGIISTTSLVTSSTTAPETTHESTSPETSSSTEGQTTRHTTTFYTTTSQTTSSSSGTEPEVTTEISTPEPWLRTFEIDVKEDGDPWHYSGTSENPITVNWFSYFSSWRASDLSHVAEYFEQHQINTTCLKNSNTGFWTSFSNKLCYLVPGSRNVPTFATTPTYCHDKEYPHFTLEFNDPSRYHLEYLEVTYALHYKSAIVIHDTETEIAYVRRNQEDPLVWNIFSYNFTSDEEYSKIQIDLAIGSENMDSGEFVLIDKIMVTVLDTQWEEPTTTTPSPSTITSTNDPWTTDMTSNNPSFPTTVEPETTTDSDSTYSLSDEPTSSNPTSSFSSEVPLTHSATTEVDTFSTTPSIASSYFVGIAHITIVMLTITVMIIK